MTKKRFAAKKTKKTKIYEGKKINNLYVNDNNKALKLGLKAPWIYQPESEKDVEV